MKTATVFLVGFFTSLAAIYFLAANIENGDSNAIGMYFVVFLLPAIVIVLLNTLYIKALSKLSNRTTKILLCLAPIAILFVLSLRENLRLPGIDGNLTFAATVGAIAIGLTNLFWIMSQVKPKST